MNNGEMSKLNGLIKMITNLLHNATMDKIPDKNFNDTLKNLTLYIEILKGLSRNGNNDYCIDFVRDIASAYSRTHGYLSLIVCIFGTIANVLNIAVLTRKDMVCTPVNRILTGLAVADMMVMIEYIPFAYYYYFVLPRRNDFPYSWAVYMLFHTNFAQVLHTISICLTLALAIWRYIAIRYPERSHVLCTEHRCTLAISISYVLPILLCSPSYMVTEIRTTEITENGKTFDLYHVDLSDFAKTNELFYVFCFWTYSVFIKLLPCILLTIISYWLIKALCRAKKRKQILRAYNKCPTMLADAADRRPNKSERRTERTTKMLVAVLLLFLITEVPQGILGLLSGIFGKEFFRHCYHLTGEFMDILALLNGAINFILYCSMSRQFRQTFNQLFKPKILAKYPPPSQEEVHTTYV